MSLDGSLAEKLTCILESQQKIHDRMQGLEEEATLRGELMLEHIKRFDKHVQYEEESLREYDILHKNIQDVLYNQKVLLRERQDSIDFWKKMKEKLATAGIFGTLGVLGSIIMYAIQNFIEHIPK